MQIQILRQSVKNVLRSDVDLQASLAGFNGISIWAIGQWRLKNNPMLTTVDNLKIIGEYLKISNIEELTQSVAVDKNGNIVGVNARGELIDDVETALHS